MGSKAKLYTIDITSPEELITMIEPTTSDELRIINYRFEFDHTGLQATPDSYVKAVYVTLGSSTTAKYFVDKLVGFYSCPLMCDNSYVDPVNFRSVTFASGTNIPFTVPGKLDNQYTARLYDSNKTLISAAILKHCFIQFEHG